MNFLEFVHEQLIFIDGKLHSLSIIIITFMSSMFSRNSESKWDIYRVSKKFQCSLTHALH
jgi:hypothetical protein